MMKMILTTLFYMNLVVGNFNQRSFLLNKQDLLRIPLNQILSSDRELSKL